MQPSQPYRFQDEPYANRWLILIAYLMGLSIGAHLLNLLTIPALVLIYYFKKYEPSTKGIIMALVISCVILALILYGIVPGFVEVAGWFELFFVNTLGFGFNSGTILDSNNYLKKAPTKSDTTPNTKQNLSIKLSASGVQLPSTQTRANISFITHLA